MPHAPGTFIGELGRLLGWGRKASILMLYGFVDESGEHDAGNGNRLVRLTVGGALASFQTWEALSLEWAEMNERHNRLMFHAADDKHHASYLANALRVIRARTDMWLFGICVEAREAKNVFKLAYGEGVIWVLKHLNQQTGMAGEDEFHLVVSLNTEFPSERIDRYANKLARARALPRLSGTSTAKPETCCPLQLADLTAHAIKCAVSGDELLESRILQTGRSFYWKRF